MDGINISGGHVFIELGADEFIHTTFAVLLARYIL